MSWSRSSWPLGFRFCGLLWLSSSSSSLRSQSSSSKLLSTFSTSLYFRFWIRRSIHHNSTLFPFPWTLQISQIDKWVLLPVTDWQAMDNTILAISNMSAMSYHIKGFHPQLAFLEADKLAMTTHDNVLACRTSYDMLWLQGHRLHAAKIFGKCLGYIDWRGSWLVDCWGLLTIPYYDSELVATCPTPLSLAAGDNILKHKVV